MIKNKKLFVLTALLTMCAHATDEGWSNLDHFLNWSGSGDYVPESPSLLGRRDREENATNQSDKNPLKKQALCLDIAGGTEALPISLGDALNHYDKQRLAALKENFPNGQTFTVKNVQEAKIFKRTSGVNFGEFLNYEAIGKILKKMVNNGVIRLLVLGGGVRGVNVYQVVAPSESEAYTAAPLLMPPSVMPDCGQDLTTQRLTALKEHFPNGQSFAVQDVINKQIFKSANGHVKRRTVRGILEKMKNSGQIELLNRVQGSGCQNFYRIAFPEESWENIAFSPMGSPVIPDYDLDLPPPLNVDSDLISWLNALEDSSAQIRGDEINNFENTISLPSDLEGRGTPAQELTVQRLAALKEHFSNGHIFTVKDVVDKNIFRHKGNPLKIISVRQALQQMIEDKKIMVCEKGIGRGHEGLYKVI